jgi:hypothetical protein
MSWQALSRALRGNSRTLLADDTVLILFAGFFIQSNVDDLVEEMNMTRSMRTFLGKRSPGLQDKLDGSRTHSLQGKKPSQQHSRTLWATIAGCDGNPPGSQPSIVSATTSLTAESMRWPTQSPKRRSDMSRPKPSLIVSLMLLWKLIMRLIEWSPTTMLWRLHQEES